MTTVHIFKWPPSDASESWWVGSDRLTFTERAWREVDRMKRNKESSQVLGFQLDRIAAPLPGKTAFKSLERGV